MPASPSIASIASAAGADRKAADEAAIVAAVGALFGETTAKRLKPRTPPLGCAAMTVDGWTFRFQRGPGSKAGGVLEALVATGQPLAAEASAANLPAILVSLGGSRWLPVREQADLAGQTPAVEEPSVGLLIQRAKTLFEDVAARTQGDWKDGVRKRVAGSSDGGWPYGGGLGGG